MSPKPPLPEGQTEEGLLAWLESFSDPAWDDRARREFQGYLRGDLRRFLHTLALVPEGEGRLLEVGASPYFTTLLLRRFRRHRLTLTNGTGEAAGNQVLLRGPEEEVRLSFERFNMEEDPPPAGPFAVVLCCEVLEHMTRDPLRALAALNQALEPGGTLVLTTPNAARMSAVLGALAGVHSGWGQYSAYGPYGRHNREYAPPELRRLLAHAGFEVEVLYTADVEPPGTGSAAGALLRAALRLPLAAARQGVHGARRLLGGGQAGPPAGFGTYCFVRARKVGPPDPRKPAWLYVSYPDDQVAPG